MTTAVITDITRMRGRNVCVAALDADRGQQIRLDSPQPTESNCANLDIGMEISVAWSQSQNITAPHVEDGHWEPQSLNVVRLLSKAELLDLLHSSVRNRIAELFGDPWRRARNGNIGYQPEVGQRSLGSVIVDRVSIHGEGNGLRVLFNDSDGRYIVPLQDLHVRLHQYSCPQCERDWVGQVHRAYADRSVLLRLGLTRPYEIPGYHPPTCWLQVNHIIPLDPAGLDHFRIGRR